MVQFFFVFALRIWVSDSLCLKVPYRFNLAFPMLLLSFVFIFSSYCSVCMIYPQQLYISIYLFCNCIVIFARKYIHLFQQMNIEPIFGSLIDRTIRINRMCVKYYSGNIRFSDKMLWMQQPLQPRMWIGQCAIKLFRGLFIKTGSRW